MPKFELLGGKADIGDGKIYTFSPRRKTVVESDLPLDKMFKNQFKRLEGVTRVPPDHRDTPNLSGTQVTDDLDANKKRLKTKVVRVPEGEEEEELVDVTPAAGRPRKLGKRVELEQSRGIVRDEEVDAEREEEAAMEEGEDLPEGEEDEGASEEDSEAAGEEQADEESEEQPEPPRKKKAEMKAAKAQKEAKAAKKKRRE